MNAGDPRCTHKVCNRHAVRGDPWHCYLRAPATPDPAVSTPWTHSCRCGTVTQGGTAGLAAHQATVGCPTTNYLPLDFVVTRRRS